MRDRRRHRTIASNMMDPSAKEVPMEIPAMAPSDSSFLLQYETRSVILEVGPVTVVVVVMVGSAIVVVVVMVMVVVEMLFVGNGGGNVEIPLLTSQKTAVSGTWPPRATKVLQWG